MIEKVEELSKFKDEAKDLLMTDSIRIKNIETDFKVNIKNIENILSSSVIYPGLIGYSGKFKSFHDYMDYTLSQISEFNIFKEKNIHDLIPYKKKMDETLENIKYQMNHIINLANEFAIKKIEDSENRLKSMIQLYDDRLQDTRVENAHYSIGLEKKSEELSRLIKNVYEIKADIFKRVKDEMTNMKGEQRTMLKLVSSYKKEFGQIKDKFIQLSEFIRDVRFRVNIAPELQKKEFIAFSKKLSYNYKDRDNDRASFSGSERKSMINRADTFNFKNKNYLNSGSDIKDIFESPYFNSQNKNKYYPNTHDLKKRNSMQINNFNKLSNKVIKKFDISKEKEKENSKINSNEKSENNLGRRKTEALLTPKNFSKDFNNISDKKEKEKDGNNSIIFSSDSSGEEKPKQKSKEKEKEKEKNQFIIKEEDENENNMSEITEEHNKKKTVKENKISDENENKSSVIINEEEEIQKKEEEKNKKDTQELEKNNDKTINININKKDNTSFNNKITELNKIYSSKSENRNEKSIKLQVNKSEKIKGNIKGNERNNTVSIISINDMFMNQNRTNRLMPFVNSSRNFLYSLSIENNYLKQNQMAVINNKYNPPKTRVKSYSFKNTNNKNKISANLDAESTNNFEKTYMPYKTFSNFSNIGLDKIEGKKYINSKIVLLNNNNNKIIKEVANNFLNKKINKISLNKEPNIFKKINAS